jgi:glycosyltransferase involved in cell wall biosynthesis
MKILFTTAQTSFQEPGGGEIQLEKTAEALRSRGHEVDIFNEKRCKISEYDILHAFGTHPDNYRVIDYADSLDVEVALSTIYWNQEAYEESLSWKMKEIFISSIKKKLEILGSNIFSIKELYDIANVLLPNSREEANLISKEYNINDLKMFKVPNGVEERFYHYEEDESEFRERYEINEKFDLFVGRIEERKNIKNLVRAYNQSKRKLVIIGPVRSNSKEYYKEAKKLSEENIFWIGGLEHDSEVLMSAYYNAEVFVLPSKCETPGLAALEAAAAGCNIAITEQGSTKEYFGDKASYLDPCSVESIINAVDEASNSDRSTELAKYVKENYTWDAVGKETEKAYMEVLK